MYLTPYIELGEIEIARKLNLVTDVLDSLSHDEQPETYSGFLTVKEDTENNMFFWFIPATAMILSSQLPNRYSNFINDL